MTKIIKFEINQNDVKEYYEASKKGKIVSEKRENGKIIVWVAVNTIIYPLFLLFQN